MENNVIMLYDKNDVTLRKRKSRIWLIISAVIFLLGVTICVLLGVNTNVKNASINEWACIAVFALTGWVCIYILYNVVDENRRENAHTLNMFSSVPDCAEGYIEVSKDRLRIPSSIRIYRVTLNGDGFTETFSVNAEKADKLPSGDKKIKLYTVNGYVFSYEVIDEIS